MSVKEYRRHFLNIYPEINNQKVWDYITNESNLDEFGCLYYAVGKHNNDGGDEHYNPKLQEAVSNISKLFPNFTFEFSWKNSFNNKDKWIGKYINGELVLDKNKSN